MLEAGRQPRARAGSQQPGRLGKAAESRHSLGQVTSPLPRAPGRALQVGILVACTWVPGAFPPEPAGSWSSGEGLDDTGEQGTCRLRTDVQWQVEPTCRK